MILAIILILVTLPLLFKRTHGNVLFPKEGSLRIRGIFAILIIFHHSTYEIHIEWFDRLFGDIGMWICGIFFMQSGYALYINRQQYGKMKIGEFFRKRISGLLYDYLLISGMYIFCSTLSYEFHLQSFLESIRNGSTMQILPYSWFIIELTILYFFTFISFKTKYAITSIFVLSLALIVTFYRLGFGCEWWMSTMAYPLGTLIQRLESQEWYLRHNRMFTPRPANTMYNFS